MTYEQFAHIVRKRENEAKYYPVWYRVRVLLLIALAYGFIFFILALTLGLVGGLVGLTYLVIMSHRSFGSLRLLIPLTLGAIAFAFVVLRSLWVRIPEPEGVELRREQAIPLFQEIDRLRSEMGIARFDRVLLTDDVNAAVVQIPRLGIFGWPKNFLIMGVPLMLVTSPDQLRAVLAHEMGHISGKHSLLGGWTYRLERSWIDILSSLEAEEHVGALPFLWFFSWYAPFFAAFSFALRRQDEYEADRAAAQVVGSKMMAASLIGVRLTMRAMSEPPENLPIPSNTAIRWLNDAMADNETSVDDTHPPLSARLRSLGESAFLPEPHDKSAAEVYLGHQLMALAARVGIQFSDAPPQNAPPASPAVTLPDTSSAAGLRPVGG